MHKIGHVIGLDGIEGVIGDCFRCKPWTRHRFELDLGLSDKTGQPKAADSRSEPIRILSGTAIHLLPVRAREMKALHMIPE
jgi:hypothetical protein